MPRPLTEQYGARLLDARGLDNPVRAPLAARPPVDLDASRGRSPPEPLEPIKQPAKRLNGQPSI